MYGWTTGLWELYDCTKDNGILQSTCGFKIRLCIWMLGGLQRLAQVLQRSLNAECWVLRNWN